MPISYKKLWKILIDLKMKKTDLLLKANISTNVLAKLGKDEAVSLESLEKICQALNCNIGDIIDFLPEPEILEEIK